MPASATRFGTRGSAPARCSLSVSSFPSSRKRSSRSRREIWGVAMAVAAHIAFALGTLLLKDAQVSPLFVLVWQAGVVGSLLIYIRFLLHHALLEEAAHMGFAETVCPNCHMHIVASGFCPNCGVALTAAPMAGKGPREPPARPTAHGAGKGQIPATCARGGPQNPGGNPQCPAGATPR